MIWDIGFVCIRFKLICQTILLQISEFHIGI